jgi:hypothetical protein
MRHAGSVVSVFTLLLLWSSPALAQLAGKPPGALMREDNFRTIQFAPGGAAEASLPPDFMDIDASSEATSDSAACEPQDTVCVPTSSGSGPTSYATIDYLFWSLPGAGAPRLLTSNPTGTPLGAIASPSEPSTQSLLGGNSEFGDWGHSGLRLRFGRIMDDSRLHRWELTGWILFEEHDDTHDESASGEPILARPFTNATTGLPDAQVLSLNGVADGSLRSQYARTLYGIDPLAFFCLSGSPCRSLEFFTGYRYLHYEDELRLFETVRPEAGGLIAPGTEFSVEDTFTAANDFHLLPLGLHFAQRKGNWRLSARGSVALGFVRQEVEIRGQTSNSVGGVVDSVETGGLLALASNMGTYDRTRFAVLPELTLAAHRAVGQGKWVRIGYTVLFLNDVVRAPSQIDDTIDPGQLPPAIGTGTRPQFAFASQNELLHGLNAGFEWHY